MDSTLINGQPLDTIPVTDRGFNYGDGLFETVAVVNGVPRLWQRHMKRLQRGCERLNIPSPDSALLEQDVQRLTLDRAACVIKIIISRGSGGRGYRPPEAVMPNRVVMRFPYPDYPQEYASEGVAIRICETPLGCNPRLAGIKHLNRLEQVLARSEWSDPAIVEGLMLDGQGHPVEGTMTNLFLVCDGTLYTPDLSRCGVEGVMRGLVIETAQAHQLPLRIDTITTTMLEKGSELFLCNSLIGIWPVVRCDNHSYPTGPMTSLLQHALVPFLES